MRGRVAEVELLRGNIGNIENENIRLRDKLLESERKLRDIDTI